MYGPRCPKAYTYLFFSVVFMAWIREVQNAKEVVNKELSSLADMFRKYNRDEDKDKDDKGRGGKKRKPRKQKNIDASGYVLEAEIVFCVFLMIANCVGMKGKFQRVPTASFFRSPFNYP